MPPQPPRPSCPLCAASAEPGWLCAEHPGKPWKHDGCRAEGMPCVCNPQGAVGWADVYKEAEPPEGSPPHLQ